MSLGPVFHTHKISVECNIKSSSLALEIRDLHNVFSAREKVYSDVQMKVNPFPAGGTIACCFMIHRQFCRYELYGTWKQLKQLPVSLKFSTVAMAAQGDM